MYSGITQGLFPIVKVTKKTGLIDYTVELGDKLMQGVTLGCSINIDGVCQSVSEIKDNQVSFTAMQQTLQLTTLDELKVGQLVSIERSLKFGDEIGGHLIAGHVTGTATVAKLLQQDNNLGHQLQVPKEWLNYIFPQGFIAINGSSLTVAQVEPEGFITVHYIPETLRLTNFGKLKVNDKVNIELDHTTRTIVDTVLKLQKKGKC